MYQSPKTDLPAWIDFPESDNQQIGQDVGSFAKLLKQRMTKPDPMAQKAGAYANKVAGEPPPMMGAAGKGGGMKSL